MLSYYGRWLRIVFLHAYGLADALSSLIGVFLPPVLWVFGFQDTDRIVGHLVWQIPLAAFVFAFLPRLILAPYWMHQEDEAKREAEWVKEKVSRAELEDELEAGRIRQEALLAQRSQREEQETCLEELLSEGGRLKAQRVDSSDRMKQWTQDYTNWRMRIQAEVGRHFSPAVATAWLTLDCPIDRCVISFDGNHQQGLARISAITQEMRAMSQDLSTKN